jgi:hypothetical protein
MSRVVTSNYGAEATTQFAWATTDADQFDRELDLYHLSQALEGHTHGSGRGLAVSRLATGAVDAAAIAGLAVGTAALAALSVTNAKLAAGAVTMDKITIPLVQATDNFVGGFRLRDSTNTYQVGHYIAANGLAVFGAGPIAGISTANLILGQTGQVSVGTVQGAAKFNVFPTGVSAGSGFRLYSSNAVNYLDIWHDGGLSAVFNNSGATNSLFLSPTSGYATFGPAASGAAKVTISQSAGNGNEGFRLIWGTGNGYGYVIDSGAFLLQSGTTAVQLEHSRTALTPVTNLSTSLGMSDLRWSKVWTQDIDISGTVTGAGSFPLNGVIWFPTLANLTSAGRLLVGAGTTFSQTFTEATNYGSNWTPASGVSVNSPTGTASSTVLMGQTSGANTNATPDHTHTTSLSGTGTAWLPPMRAGVWGQRIS